MSDLYEDRWITCDADALVIRWYYLWGAKRIRYASIRSVTQVGLSPLRGRGRIWGTANLRYWASLDPGRPGKNSGLILDVGTAVKPFITPDNVAAVAAIIVGRAGLSSLDHQQRGPVI
jgi:hypothetical protein